MSLNRCFVVLLAACTAAVALHAQTPAWIWYPNRGTSAADDEVRYFRKAFTIDSGIRKAILGIAADNHFTAYVNGKRVGNGTGWEQLRQLDVTRDLAKGANSLAIEGRNDSGVAALLVRLEITTADGKKQTVVSDTSWLSAAEKTARWEARDFAPQGWVAARSLGALGVAPWGNITAAGTNRRRQQDSGGRPATPAESLTVSAGFKVELLRSAQAGEGSWVSMTVDAKGRLIVSPQGNEPLLRLTLDGQGQIAKLEKLDTPVHAAMGLLYAFDSLYANGQGPDGYHLYRLQDTNGDDQYDKVELLRKWNGNRGGNGEHGAHGIVLGPDQKLYVVCGNFVDVPDDILPSSPHRNYADDQVLRRAEDGNGFGAGRKPPGGYVLRMDPDGSRAELFASGERNTYDIGFNSDGELFAFDSDMEWDWGTPWYRPVRVHHVVSGADHGFREGTAKWPTWYPDSLPPVVEIGIGSPTGVRFGTGAKFPAKFQRAFYIMDWSYGRIIAVHLTPQGSSYGAQWENFVVGKPLNVTDMEIGPDGAMYFATGGRGTQSGLYRVSYTGGESTAPAERAATMADQRALRHRVESFHGRHAARAIETAWPLLSSEDRYLRYAARLAIESQPVDEWQQRALDERDANASITALLALARCGSKDVQDQLISALGKLRDQQLSADQTLEAVRVLEVCLARMGRPSDDLSQKIVARLDESFPANDPRLNRELAQVLIYFEAPGIAKKCLDLVAAAPSQEEQLHYIFHLRNLKSGWTLPDRERYFAWFNRDRAQDQHPHTVEQWFADVGQKAHDGASFPKFIANIKKDAVATLSDAERVNLASLLEGQPMMAAKKTARQRQFVREWKVADFESALAQVSRGRSWARGKEVFTTAQCVACHRFGNEGGTVAPDITAAASKYSRRDILESILEPSKVIADQYQNITIVKKDADEISGRLVDETPDKLVVIQNLLEPDQKTVVPKSEVRSRAAAKLSGMPEGLVNIFTREEILDLLAYIESGGNQKHAAFAR